MQNKAKSPKGVLILGALLVIFGVLSLINHFTLDYDRYLGSLNRIEIEQEGIQPQIGQDQIKAFSKISLIFSVFLFLCGVGIFYRKEAARKAIVYFSVFIIGIFILTAMVQSTLIIFIFPQFLFFSAITLYFTKKSIKELFLREKS